MSLSGRLDACSRQCARRRWPRCRPRTRPRWPLLCRVSEDELGAMSADEAECVIAGTQRAINALTARQNVALTRYTDHVLDTRDAQRAARRRAARRHRWGNPLRCRRPPPPWRRSCGSPRGPWPPAIHAAQTLSGLPRTAAMGWAGDLEPYRASAITRAARPVGHAQLSEFEARLHHGDIRELPSSRVKARANLIAARLMPEPDPDRPRPGRPGERSGSAGAGGSRG